LPLPTGEGAGADGYRDSGARGAAHDSYALQPMVVDLLNQVTVPWQADAQPLGLERVLAHGACGDTRIRAQCFRFDFSAEPHAVEHVLVACGREHFLDAVELVVEPRRLISPEQQ